MNLQESKQRLEEMKAELARLNSQFDEIMKQNNLTEADLKNNDSELPKEVADAWEKVKKQIQQEHSTQKQNTAKTSSRRNIIRM